MSKLPNSWRAAALVLAWAAAGPMVGAQAPTAAELDAQVKEIVRQLESDNRYGAAEAEVSKVITTLRMLATANPRGAYDPVLAGAYELRARAHFQLGRKAEAQVDLQEMLRLSPTHVMPADRSPRLLELFDKVRAETLVNLSITGVPEGALLELDGRAESARSMVLGPGQHELRVSMRGHEPHMESLLLSPGETREVAVALKRVKATLIVMTSPPNVEVFIDGNARGQTPPGPPDVVFAAIASDRGLQPSQASAPLVFELSPGDYRLEARRDCYRTAAEHVRIENLADYPWTPRLEPAHGTLVFATAAPEAEIFLDGRSWGPARQELSAVCEGEHRVELRSPRGRLVQRVNVETGQRHQIAGQIRPAVALVHITSSASPTAGLDLRETVEFMLARGRALTMFAPVAADVDAALADAHLTRGWLSYDENGRPATDIARQLPDKLRLEGGRRVARRLGVQGIAELTEVGGVGSKRYALSLLAEGSATPDVLELSLERNEQTSTFLDRLATVPALTRPTTGLVVADVRGRGPVVVAIAPELAKAFPTLQLGDSVLRFGGNAVATVAEFDALVQQKPAGTKIPIELRSPTGATHQGQLTVATTPRLIGLDDVGLIPNRLILEYRFRLASNPPPDEEAALRLNLAMALMRVQSWESAVEHLEHARAMPALDAMKGAVRYLEGRCYEELQQFSDAADAYRDAAARPSERLVEDGETIAELANARAAEVKRRASGARGQ